MIFIVVITKPPIFLCCMARRVLLYEHIVPFIFCFLAFLSQSFTCGDVEFINHLSQHQNHRSCLCHTYSTSKHDDTEFLVRIQDSESVYMMSFLQRNNADRKEHSTLAYNNATEGPWR